MRELLEAGVHFGHQTKRWNPKMRPFIFGARNGIHIIDLQHTVKLFKPRLQLPGQTPSPQATPVLFVGTKKQAQDVIHEEALRAGQFYVTNRWLGGTLTNFQTRQGLDRAPARDREDGRGRHLRAHDQEGGPRRRRASARSWRRRSAASRT